MTRFFIRDGMKQPAVVVTVIFIMVMFFCTQAGAEEPTPAPNYSGDFWSRSTLTGDWGGLRNDLARKGATIDFSVTQIVQGVVGGGKESVWEYGGRGDFTLSLDTQKMGLWPGGFITVEAEGNFSNAVNAQTGALLPVNTNQLFPTTGSDELNITAVSMTQFLSHHFGVFFGKIATITSTAGDMNEFAHGKGDTQFFNLAFNANPVILLTVPYSTLAAGAVILPTGDPKEAIITFTALDGNGEANSPGFDTVAEGNTTYAAEARVRTGFFGLTGHQLVGGTYSTRNFSSIDQNLRLFLVNRTIQQKDNSWCFYYNFDQYLYETKKGSGQGIGVFGRFGASDGDPNPVHYFYSIGIGGKGLLPSRPLDNFGIGYFYIDVSNPTLTGPFGNTRSFLRDEYGLEAFYNFAITPWMHLTPDIQYIRPAQKNAVSLISTDEFGLPIINRSGISSATVVGLRLQVVF